MCGMCHGTIIGECRWTMENQINAGEERYWYDEIERAMFQGRRGDCIDTGVLEMDVGRYEVFRGASV